MVKNKLTMSPKFLKKIGITDIEKVKKHDIDIRNILEDLCYESNYDKVIENGHPISFPKYMEHIEKEYGSVAKLLLWFGYIEDYLYEPGGTYPHLFGSNLLMTEECQTTEYYDLDLLKTYGNELAIFISNFKNSAYRLNEHFEEVKIQVDDRRLIYNTDPEHAENVERIVDLVEQAVKDDGDNEAQILLINRDSSFDGVIFENNNQGEIRNAKEVLEFDQTLKDLVHHYNIEGYLQEEFRKLAIKCLDVKSVELYLCTDRADGPTQQDCFYFSDMMGHPKYITDEFKKSLDRFLISDKKNMIVETFSPHIVDVIRHAIVNGRIKLKYDMFVYENDMGEHLDFKITDKGKFEPEFPSGFFDITLDLIYEINKGS